MVAGGGQGIISAHAAGEEEIKHVEVMPPAVSSGGGGDAGGAVGGGAVAGGARGGDGVDVDQDIEPSSLIQENLGLVCSEDGDRFVVAELHQLDKTTTNDKGVLAELTMFRSDGGGPSSSWELMHLPLDYHPGMRCFGPQAVVPFGSCLCWVDYRLGMILADDVLQHKSPKLYYVPFPPVASKRPGGASDTFTISTYTLTTTEAGRMGWEKDAAVPPMTAEELWGLEALAPVPHEVPLFPLASMDRPEIIRFQLSEWYDYVDTVTLVTIDMIARTVVSVRPYIKGEQELHGEDADLAEARSSLLQPFLPAEFSTSSLQNLTSTYMTSNLANLSPIPFKVELIESFQVQPVCGKEVKVLY
ncbi:hypothetical protein C2845_PM13G25590 [Panicum miliaceum]|uniref:Uncharacterized protein n=1 Tax=Panicum miliaceum TaxID=4540 RepID=A0A3L6RF88_PANMI|nr:hypothetical protein C2845_PM13G25590 [Panicum miliaceum]